MTAPLGEMQYEIGGIVLGPGTPYQVARVDFGTVESRAADADRPREDGIRFGRDYRRPRVITLDLQILTRPGTDALDALAALEAVWDAEAIRDRPGEVLALRMRRAGRIRRVYGRPRNFASTTGRTLAGWIPVTCSFQAVDHRFYGDEATEVTYQLTRPPTSGITSPLVAPVTTTPVESVPGTVRVGGNTAAWLVVEIRGPITRPVVDVVGLYRVTLDVVLQAGETVRIDPRPWVRRITRNGIANAGGALSADSPRLRDMRIPPGTREVVLRGVDPTGTASMTVQVTDTWTSY